MAAPFHFFQSCRKQFAADAAAPGCRMRCQADNVGRRYLSAPEIQCIGIEMGQTGHLVTLKAHEDLFRLIEIRKIPLKKRIFPMFETVIPEAFYQAPVLFTS